MNDISFEFEKTNYSVDYSAYATDHIKLPDGRILQVQGWFESMPPYPQGFLIVDEFSGATPAKIKTITN